ncbi:unnamed protein product [Absidia cylindrospora]
MPLVSLLPTPPISPSDGSVKMTWPPPSTSSSSDQVQTMDVQILQRYLDRGGQCNIRHPGTTLSLLAWATKSSSVQGIQMLLNESLERNNSPSKPQQQAAGMVKELLLFPSSHGVTAIHMATQQNFVQALALFNQFVQLEKKQRLFPSSSCFLDGILADDNNDWLNVVDGIKRWTPLHYGVQANACQAVDFLLHHGAFGSPKDRLGVTPLALALMLNHVDLVDRLIHTLDDHDFIVLLQQKDQLQGDGKVALSNDLWTLVFKHHYDDLDGYDYIASSTTTSTVQPRDEWLYLSVFWNRGDVLALLLQYHQGRNRNRKNEASSPAVTLPISSSSPPSDHSTTTAARDPFSLWKRPEDHILFYALQQGKLEMVKQLFGAGYSPPISPLGDNPCLLYAAAHGFLDVISLLYTSSTSDDCLQLVLQLSGHLRSHVLQQLNCVLSLEKIMLLNPTDFSALAL